LLSKNIRLLVTLLGVSVILFISLYLSNAYLSGTWSPIWFWEMDAATALLLGTLLTCYRPALRKLPLLLLLYSPLWIRPLSGLHTMPYFYFSYLAFCSATWGVFLLLTPPAREALIKSPSEFLKSPMVQDEEESPANTEVCKGESDEVLRHWTRNSDEKRFNQCFTI